MTGHVCKYFEYGNNMKNNSCPLFFHVAGAAQPISEQVASHRDGH